MLHRLCLQRTHPRVHPSTLPASCLPLCAGKARELQSRRWLILACENKVALYDLASADTVDMARSLLFESRAPTCLAVLVLNLPNLMGLTSGAGAEAEVYPVLAVGTANGNTYIINPTTLTVGVGEGGAGTSVWSC